MAAYLRYVIDPCKLDDFERYARLWIPLVTRLGSTHHDYLLLREDASTAMNAASCARSSNNGPLLIRA